MNSRREGVINFYLEKKSLGEITPQEQATLDEVLSRDEQEQRCKAIRHENQTIIERHPFDLKRENASVLLAPTPKRRLSSPLSLSIIAVAAIILITVNPWRSMQKEDIRFKGDSSSIQFFLLAEEGQIKELRSGDKVPKGHSFQIKILPSSFPYAALLSVDSRHVINQIVPDGDKMNAQKLTENQFYTPARAMQLDDTPGAEIFYLFLSHKIFNLSELQTRMTSWLNVSDDPKKWPKEFDGQIEAFKLER